MLYWAFTVLPETLSTTHIDTHPTQDAPISYAFHKMDKYSSLARSCTWPEENLWFIPHWFTAFIEEVWYNSHILFLRTLEWFSNFSLCFMLFNSGESRMCGPNTRTPSYRNLMCYTVKGRSETCFILKWHIVCLESLVGLPGQLSVTVSEVHLLTLKQKREMNVAYR